MIIGTYGAPVMVVESEDSHQFCSDCMSVINCTTGNDTFYEINQTFIDSHYYKAIFILKRSE